MVQAQREGGGARKLGTRERNGGGSREREGAGHHAVARAEWLTTRHHLPVGGLGGTCAREEGLTLQKRETE